MAATAVLLKRVESGTKDRWRTGKNPLIVYLVIVSGTSC
jgi:hypothetical protein